MSTFEEATTFQLHAPQKGSYLLDIFASVYPTFEQCQTEEVVKYINVCRFKINCHGLDKVGNIIIREVTKEKFDFMSKFGLTEEVQGFLSLLIKGIECI